MRLCTMCRWDLCCCEAAEWQSEVHDCRSERGTKQPFYHVLLDIATLGASTRQDLNAAGLTNFTAYVPEDSLSAPSVSPLATPRKALQLRCCSTDLQNSGLEARQPIRAMLCETACMA